MFLSQYLSGKESILGSGSLALLSGLGALHRCKVAVLKAGRIS